MVAAQRARASRLETIFEGSGALSIPIEAYLWPERRRHRRPFDLSRAKLRYIEKREELPWITRASLEAFWQCRSCGWAPWPVPVMFCGAPMERDGKPLIDDSTWEWFSVLPDGARQCLVDLTREIDRFERELATSRRAGNYGRHGMREIVPNCR